MLKLRLVELFLCKLAKRRLFLLLNKLPLTLIILLDEHPLRCFFISKDELQLAAGAEAHDKSATETAPEAPPIILYFSSNDRLRLITSVHSAAVRRVDVDVVLVVEEELVANDDEEVPLLR